MDKAKMIKNPRVSVIMPVYNAEKYLHEAVESILNQTFSDFEFLIINDGSTDNSLTIINSFNDKRVKIINNQKNEGLIKSLNTGIDLAKGEYIARMDADDISLLNRLKKQIDFLDTHSDIGICVTHYDLLIGKSIKKNNFWFNSDDIKTLLLFNSCLCHPTVVIRKELFEKNNIRFSSEFKYAEDYHLWTVMARYTKFAMLDDSLLQYRHHQKQVSLSFNDQQRNTASKIRREFLSVCGFVFTDKELEFHDLVGSSQKIKTKKNLEGIEAWLSKLILTNKNETKSFNKVIGKLWLDSCGNTSLGLWSFNRYRKSTLAKEYPTKINDILKLLVKCLLR